MIGDTTKEQPKFKILKSPNLKRKQKKKFVPLNERIKLETVLGLSVTSNSGLSLDGNTGNVAYFAGCVAVIYNSRKNKQYHLFNSSKKPLSCLAYSGDGRFLATGESGHQPAVRVWDLEEMTQVAEFEGHKFGIRCVAFSPNLKYIVSVGYQHDMVVNVWNWKKNVKVASNKVASKVLDVAFSEDGSMFVTVGNRHVKFWYLNASKSKNQLETLPLLGRNGILGEHQNNSFCGVCCSKTDSVDRVFAITEAGMLCQFNDKRVLTKWVSLKTNKANALSMGDKYIFVGCSGGLVRIFHTLTLNFIASLPLPHPLGVDVALNMQGHGDGLDRIYADTVAVRYDQVNNRVCSIYDDHSMYIWDITDIKKIGKNRSFLYHNGAIWGLDIYPGSSVSSHLPINSFATCGNDNTIRFWRFNNNNNHNNNNNMNSDGDTPLKKNIYSNELVKVLYVDKDMSNLRDIQFHPGKTDRGDSNCQEKNGIRCIRFRPDGKHLASGDRVGNIRMHDMSSMTQVAQIEAHDSEVLCLEFTSPEAGLNLLVSGSRDRLIHVFDAQNNYSLIQTLDEHSAAVTAVKFVISDLQLGLVSCSADKSILFRTANVDPNFHFTLARHVVSRTTLYDMEVDMTKKFVAIACQDRNIRIYNMRTGKMKKCYGGSVGTEGILIRLQLDPTSSFVATSSSDKTLALFNFFSGECTGHMMGHAEVPTGVRFFDDLRHLISIGADGCMFIWKMDSEMTEQMNKRKAHLKDQVDAQQMRSTTFNLSDGQSTLEPPDVKPNGLADDNSFVFRFSPGQLPAWARMKFSKESSPQQPSSIPASLSWNVPLPPKGKWAQNVNTQNYPLPPSLPYFGLRDVMKAGSSLETEVPIIREDEIDHGDDDDEEEDDDEFSRDQPLQVLESEHSGQRVTEDGDVEEDDEDDNDGGYEDDDDDDAEKESNDDEAAKEDTVFLPASDPPVETTSENPFKVEENSLEKFDDGSAGENENYLSYEEDVELKSIPSSPSSSEQLPKLDSILFHGEGGGDIKNLNLSHETFEMTLKRLEVEMTNRSEVRDRCSLSAKYFNSANSNDNDNNNNNNNDVSLRDAVLTTDTGISMSNVNMKKDSEETKRRQAMNDQVIGSFKENATGSLGRRQGRSFGGSELRLAVKPSAGKPIEKQKCSSLSSSRKWKSLVDIQLHVRSPAVDDGERVSQRLDPRNVVNGKAQSMTGGQVKLKSILRSQTPNIVATPQTAASNSFSRQENCITKKKAKRSTATISMMTLNCKLEKEADPRKSLTRVRSYRMATESSQAKQQSNGSSKDMQPSRRLLPRSAKQFQSTPNLVEDGRLPKNEGDEEDMDNSVILSLNVQNPKFSSNKEQGSKELETLDEDMSDSRLESKLRRLTTLGSPEKRLSGIELTDSKEVGLADAIATYSSNGEVHLSEEPMKLNISPREELEVPERDLNGSRRLHSSISSLLKPTNQTSRPYSSNLQLKSQLQKRLLPSDPANKLSTSYIEPRSITSNKMLKLKEISSINSNLAQLPLSNQKQDDLSPKRVTSKSKWGSLKSPTNTNITFARPPSRNLYVHSPDPLQNWVKRAETIQHRWESRNNETSENGQSDLVSSKLTCKKFRGISDVEQEPRRWSIVHSRHSESMDSVTPHEPSSPTDNTEIEFPIPNRSRRSVSSNFDWNVQLGDKNTLKHTRTSSADGSYQSDEALPREGEPSSSLRDSCNIKCRKDGIRPRVAFSPVVCMMSAESTPEEERALEACDRLEDAVNTITQIYEKLREFKEQDDPILVKLKSTVEKEYQKLQELVGPSQPSSQLDRCAEDLTMKMYELIRKKIDSAPPSF